MNPVKNQTISHYLLIVSVFGFFAVAIGAFGAHALKGIVSPERMPAFETGNKYHFIHTLVSLFIIVFISQNGKSKYLKFAFWLFLVGIILFSFSLYLLAITGIKILGIITPFGGVCFLLGWLFLGMSAIQSRDEP